MRAREIVGSLVALTTISIAQPLLDLIGRNAAFLVAHDARPADVIGIGVGLPVVLPLALAAVVLVLRRVARPLGSIAHGILLVVFCGLFVLVAARLTDLSPVVPGPALIGCAVILGLLLVRAYWRSATLRRLLMSAAIAGPVVSLMFLFLSPANALLSPGRSSVALPPLGPDAPPIVVAVFDELPVASLLGADRRIDPAAFPSFARLAGSATFLRNATTVHGQTSDAVPAALDGHYPDAEKLPLAADHPQNLFALLSATYDMSVIEPITQLCPPGLCPRSGAEADSHGATLVRDLSIVGSHLVVPEDMAAGLPPLDQGWRDFRADAEAGGKEVAVRDRFREARTRRPSAGFDEFLAGIQPGGARPTLHFWHVLLPHSPWVYLPDDRQYVDVLPSPGIVLGRWVEDEWRVTQGYQRHMLQLQLADRLLGRLLDRLEEQGMYDETLVVVMADHGASFTPERSLRVIAPDTFGEIAAVPLLVKPPGQRDPMISDQPVELVDVLPSILDLIGAPIPNGLDGRSPFSDGPVRTQKRFFGPVGPLDFPADGAEKWPIVERKQRRFAASGPFEFPYNLAPPGHEEVLGRPVPANPAERPAQVEFTDAGKFAAVDLAADTVPSLVEGSVAPDEGLEPGTVVAVGVNGRIGAVTLLEGPPETNRFRVMVPPSLLRDGRNEVTLWLVERELTLLGALR